MPGRIGMRGIMVLATLAIQLAFACGDDDPTGPPSANPDAGVSVIDGGRDATSNIDSSTPGTDSGVKDAGVGDAANIDGGDDTDAGNSDAGDLDASELDDGGADADAGPPLPAPTALSAAYGNEGQMWVSWTPLVDPEVVSYTLVYGKGPAQLTEQTTVAASESAAMAITIDRHTLYYFAVRATYTGARIGGLSETISATSNGLPAITHPAQPGVRYLIEGGDMGRLFQNLKIKAVDDVTETDVNNATVTVNGVSIPSTGSEGRYGASLGAAVAPGGALNLSVTVAANVMTATGNCPAVPTISAPTTGATIARTSTIPITWTSALDPDRFWVAIDCGVAGNASFDVVGATRSVQFAGRALPAGASCTLDVLAYSFGTFTGAAARLESRMNIRESSSAGPIALTVGP